MLSPGDCYTMARWPLTQQPCLSYCSVLKVIVYDILTAILIDVIHCVNNHAIMKYYDLSVILCNHMLVYQFYVVIQVLGNLSPISSEMVM